MTSLEKRCVEPLHLYLNNVSPTEVVGKQKVMFLVSRTFPRLAVALLQCSMKQN